MPILNASPLALPDSAFLEGSWQEAIDPPSPGAGTFFSRSTPGETYEQILSATFRYITSAAAGNRLMTVAINDPNGNTIVDVPAVFSQTPGINAIYTVIGQGGTSYGNSQANQVIALPPTLLLPGYTLFLLPVNEDAADQILAVGLLLLRIPTGAPRQPAEALSPTPLPV